MLFRKKINIPANTTTPMQTAIPVEAGIVRQVDVVFPSGSLDLVHVRILWNGEQVWPTSSGEWITSNSSISWLTSYEILDQPYEFVIEAYNEDTTYDHAIIVRFNILKATSAFMQPIGSQELLAALRELTNTIRLTRW